MRRLPAGMLHEATRRLREVEQYVEDMLAMAYPGWRPLHPRARGWRFSSPDAIDVYETPAYETPDLVEGARRLHRAGFRRVTAHPHDHREACKCSSRFPAERRTPAPGDGVHASGTIDAADVTTSTEVDPARDDPKTSPERSSDVEIEIVPLDDESEDGSP